jgi:hypothetical protein
VGFNTISLFGLSGKQQRTILRYSHLLAGMLNVFFIYTPLGDVWEFQLLVQIILVPVIIITGVWMWQQARIRKLIAKWSRQGEGQEEVRNSSEPPRGEVIRLEDDRAVLIAENLPAEPEDKVCQTWLLRDGVAEPAGTFESREGGITAAPIEGSLEGAAAVAVTVEPAGGSSAPTDDPLLSTNL